MLQSKRGTDKKEYQIMQRQIGFQNYEQCAKKNKRSDEICDKEYTLNVARYFSKEEGEILNTRGNALKRPKPLA